MVCGTQASRPFYLINGSTHYNNYAIVADFERRIQLLSTTANVNAPIQTITGGSIELENKTKN